MNWGGAGREGSRNSNHGNEITHEGEKEDAAKAGWQHGL